MHPATTSPLNTSIDSAAHADTTEHAAQPSPTSPAQTQPPPASALASGLSKIGNGQRPALPTNFVPRIVALPLANPLASASTRPAASVDKPAASQAVGGPAEVAPSSSAHAAASSKLSAASADADGWNQPRGTYSQQIVQPQSLGHFLGAGGMDLPSIKAFALAMSKQDVELHGHATLPGLRGRVEMPSGPGAGGQTVKHSMGFQLNGLPGRPNIIVGLSKWENDVKVSHTVNPNLTRLFDFSRATPEERQRLSDTLATAELPTMAARMEALPSRAYLAQHGLALDHLALNQAPPAGPGDEHLKIMLRRLVTTGKIDIPRTEIDQAGRDRHIELLTVHARDQDGKVKLDGIAFLQLPPNLTWHATNDAAKNGALASSGGYAGVQGDLDAARDIKEMPPKE
jgi:hypothetical protein